MKSFRLTLSVVVALLSSPALSGVEDVPKGPTASAWDSWYNSGRYYGHLNPPWKEYSENVKKVEAYLQDLMNQLLADQLTTTDRKIVLSLYSNENPVLLGRRHAPVDKERSFENSWKRYQREEPVRLVYTGETDPEFYEVVVSTGMLAKVQNEAELAFILGAVFSDIIREQEQRRTLRAQGKTNFDINDQLSNLKEAQAENLAFDKQMLDAMLGKYQLEDVLRIVDELYKGDRQNSSFLGGALLKRVQPSVRSALLLAYINNLYRETPGAYPQVSKPLPAFVRNLLPQEERIAYFLHYEEYKNAFLDYVVNEVGSVAPKAVKKFRRGSTKSGFEEQTKEWLRNFLTEDQILENETHTNPRSNTSYPRLSPEDTRDLILSLVEAIDNKNLGSQESVDKFLLAIYQMSEAGPGREFASEKWTLADVNKIKSFLDKHSIGNAAWSFEVFFEKFKQLAVDEFQTDWQTQDSPRRVLDRQGPLGSILFGDLVSNYPSWKKMYMHETNRDLEQMDIISLELLVKHRKFSADGFGNTELQKLTIEASHKLEELGYRETIEILKATDFDAWIKNRPEDIADQSSSSYFHSVYVNFNSITNVNNFFGDTEESVRKKIRPERYSEVEAILDPYFQIYKRTWVSELEQRLNVRGQYDNTQIRALETRLAGFISQLEEDGAITNELAHDQAAKLLEFVKIREQYRIDPSSDNFHEAIFMSNNITFPGETDYFLKFGLRALGSEQLDSTQRQELASLLFSTRSAGSEEIDTTGSDLADVAGSVTRILTVSDVFGLLSYESEMASESFKDIWEGKFGYRPKGKSIDEVLADLAENAAPSGEAWRVVFENYVEEEKKAAVPSGDLRAEDSDRERYMDAAYLASNLATAVEFENSSQMSALKMLGLESESSRRLAGKFGFEEYSQLITRLRVIFKRGTVLRESIGARVRPATSVDSTRFLLDVFLENQSEIVSIDKWYQDYKTVMSMEPDKKIHGINDYYRIKLSEELNRRFEAMSPAEVYVWMSKAGIKDLYEVEDVAARLMEYIKYKMRNSDSKSQLADVITSVARDLRILVKQEKQSGVESFSERNKLVQNNRNSSLLFKLRKEVASEFKLQPGELDKVFWVDDRSEADKAGAGSLEIRGLSALVARSQKETFSEQISMVKYLIGSVDEMPSFVGEPDHFLGNESGGVLLSTGDTQLDSAVLVNAARGLREYMTEASEVERAMIVSSFLAGPEGLLKTPKAKADLVNVITEELSGDRKKFAELVTDSILAAEKNNQALALGFFLSQKPQNDNGSFTESVLLRALGIAYGVPSHKLSQYLSFSYPEYQKELEAFQDSELEPSYIELLRLIEEKFGERWSEQFKIVKLLGAGSVNLAVLLEDKKSGEIDVLQIARDEIVDISKYDFYRINKVIDEMIRISDDPKEYEFMKGLLAVVKNSVSLEFNKQDALEMQNVWNLAYQESVDGWDVRSVPGHYVDDESLSLFMGLASGRSAYKVEKENPEAFRQAIRAFVRTEFRILRGIKTGKLSEKSKFFANPDVHLGQILIDVDASKVTIIDPGQAVFISPEQRSLALRLLMVTNKFVGATEGAKVVNEISKQLNPLLKEDVLTSEQLATILEERSNVVDRVMRLVSLMELSGAEVPISSIHWIMGIHRLDTLAKKVGINLKPRIAAMMGSEKFVEGSGFKTYNGVSGIWDSVKGLFTREDDSTNPVQPRDEEKYSEAFSGKGASVCSSVIKP